jgi:hypothetical protein
MSLNRAEVPWTAEQVESLNGYQKRGAFHPFTGERGPNGEETVLIATPSGWIEREGGEVVQTWAHAFMADGSWKEEVFPFQMEGAKAP